MKALVDQLVKLSFGDKVSFISAIFTLIATIVAILDYTAPLSASLTPTAFCPAVLSNSKVNEWARIGELNDRDLARFYIDQFDEIRGVYGGEFGANSFLPKGVFIITAFGNSGDTLRYQHFDVKPIVHYRSYGIFQTTAAFRTDFEGACMVVDEPFYAPFIVPLSLFIITLALIMFSRFYLPKLKPGL